MQIRKWLRRATGSLLVGVTLVFAPLARAETVTIGLVGTASATHWPIYAGLKQGYYAAADIKLDMVFTPSSAALLQQLSVGALDACLSTGIVDPIYAIDKGAPIAIRAVLTETRHVDQDNPRIELLEGRVAKAHFVHNAGAKILEHHIRL